MEEADNKAKSIFARRSALRALRHRNFRLFFGGQSISLIGTWMQRIAMAWLVYRLTNSPFLLGVVGFAGQIPTFLLPPFAGVLADRWDKRRMLILTQTLLTIQALTLAFLVLTGTVQVWHLVALSLFFGTVFAFDIPTRQSFFIEMIGEKGDLGNAIALNSSLVTGARLLGPTVGGVLIGLLGEGACFLLNGITYFPIIFALIAMRIPPKESTQRRSRVWEGLKEGFAYVSGFAPILSILLLLALVSVMGMPYMVLMPVFAKKVLQGGPHAFGFLTAAGGLGALLGALYLAARSTIIGLDKRILLAVTLFGSGLIAFSFSRILWLSLIFTLIIGFGQMVQMASSNTIIQTIVDDDKRGRVMSFYAMSFVGMMPFGSLLAGFIASKIGTPATVTIGGIACLIGAGVYAHKLPALRKMVHPIYEKMGIIPESY
jgi:MFS family permease